MTLEAILFIGTVPLAIAVLIVVAIGKGGRC